MIRTTRTATFRWVAFLLISSFVLAACGQKAGVHQAGSLTGVPGPGGQVVDPGTGAPVDPGTGAPIDPGTPTNPNQPGQDPQNPTNVPPPPPAGGGDRTGITDDTITLAVHAPETGAAPINAEVFDKGKDLYWSWLESKGKKVFGRDVRVINANDQYNPTVAVAVCNDMARQAFLLIGAAGTDQINACAQFADGRGIPYLSPGVQEAGLNTRRTYFAVTMTYRAQMAPFVQMLKKENKGNALDRFPGGGNGTVKIGFVRPNTPNFDDADAALEQAVKAAGWEYKVYAVNKEGSSNEAQTVAAQMQQDGIDVAVPITAPTFTVQLAINTGKNNYAPKYAGVAITNNINQAIAQTCRRREFHGALFFSPWPGWDQVNKGKYDKDFSDAASKFAPEFNTKGKGGDLLLALWGIMKNVHQMMLAAGPNMSRESFVSTMSNFRINPGAFPTLRCSPTDHFCAKDTFVLEGDCDTTQWLTPARYATKRSSF